jgi:hypothetical protein
MPKGKPGSGRAGLIADLNFHKRVIGQLVEMVGVDRYVEAVKLARAQGMSTGTAKTPKAVEGRSPASPVAVGHAPMPCSPTSITDTDGVEAENKRLLEALEQLVSRLDRIQRPGSASIVPDETRALISPTQDTTEGEAK